MLRPCTEITFSNSEMEFSKSRVISVILNHVYEHETCTIMDYTKRMLLTRNNGNNCPKVFCGVINGVGDIVNRENKCSINFVFDKKE